MVTVNVGEALPTPQTAATAPTNDAADVISLFSNAYTDVPIDTWNTGWEFSTAVLTDVQVAGDDVKRYTNLNFVGIEFVSQTIDLTSMTHFRLDFWTPDPTTAPASFKVLLVDFGADGAFDGGDDASHEVSITAANTPEMSSESWVSLDIPLADFTGLTSKGHLAQMVLSGDLSTVYVDNVYFYDSGNEAPDNEPSAPAPAPTADADSVISMFSNAYSNETIDTWNTGWEFSTAVLADVQVAGDDVKLYTNLNFVGIEFATQTIDASEMNRFHMDIWTPDPSAAPAEFKIKLIDFGGDGVFDGGDDSEHELTFTASTDPALATESWVSIDVPMSAFSGLSSQAHLAQMVLSGDPNTVYIDNVYFYAGATITESTPSAAAPTPSFSAGDVVSLFSNAYTDVTIDTWNTGWEFSTAVLADVQVAGDDVKLYTDLNFVGIEFSSQTIDASLMTHFYVDIWTPDPSAAPAEFKIKLIDFGGDGAFAGGDDSEHELTFTASTDPALATGSWVTMDIPLSSFTGLTSQGHLAQLVFSGDPNTVYVDNVLLHR